MFCRRRLRTRRKLRTNQVLPVPRPDDAAIICTGDTCRIGASKAPNELAEPKALNELTEPKALKAPNALTEPNELTKPQETADSIKYRKRLGSGTFGSVFSVGDGTCEKHTSLYNSDGDENFGEFIREVAALQMMKPCPHIITSLNIGVDMSEEHIRSPNGNNDIYGVVTMLECESACEIDQLSAAETLTLAAHIISALRDLHAQNISHLDVKPANILRQVQGDGTPLFMLCDFNVSRINTRYLTVTDKTTVTTPMVAPPELCNNFDRTAPVDLQRLDMWGLGISLCIFYTGYIPPELITTDYTTLAWFHHVIEKEGAAYAFGFDDEPVCTQTDSVKSHLGTPKSNTRIHREILLDLISALLQEDPNQRATAASVYYMVEKYTALEKYDAPKQSVPGSTQAPRVRLTPLLSPHTNALDRATSSMQTDDKILCVKHAVHLISKIAPTVENCYIAAFIASYVCGSTHIKFRALTALLGRSHYTVCKRVLEVIVALDFNFTTG
jgi:serine/threonine protein kinase